MACAFHKSHSLLGGDPCILLRVAVVVVVVCNPPVVCCIPCRSLVAVVVAGDGSCSCGSPENRTGVICSSRHSACAGYSKPCCNPVTSVAAVVVVGEMVDSPDNSRVYCDGSRVYNYPRSHRDSKKSDSWNRDRCFGGKFVPGTSRGKHVSHRSCSGGTADAGCVGVGGAGSSVAAVGGVGRVGGGVGVPRWRCCWGPSGEVGSPRV